MPDPSDIHLVKPCEICGSVGFKDLIGICSKCHTSREHFYCMRTALKKVKVIDDWVCEECIQGNIMGFPDVCHHNAMSPEGQCKVYCDLRRRSPYKSQKNVQTGKVKFLPMEEVLKLSSRVSPNSAASLPKAPMVSRNLNPGFNNIRVKPNPSFTRFVKPLNHGGLQSVSIADQQETKLSNNSKASKEKAPDTLLKKDGCSVETVTSKGAKEVESLKENPEDAVTKTFAHSTSVPSFPINVGIEERTVIPDGRFEEQAAHTIKPVRETNIFSIKIKKRKRSSRPSIPRFPPDKFVFSCKNPHTAAKPLRPDIGKREISSTRPKLSQCWPYLPAHYSTWKGGFKFSNVATEDELYGGFLAQPPCRVHRKAYELSQKIPMVLMVELLPFHLLKIELFHDNFLELCDIGLYFFPEDNIKRSKQNCSYLAELMEKRNSVIRAEIEGNELLIFAPKLLHEDSHDICRSLNVDFLLGVFINACNGRTLHKMYDEVPLLVSPLEYGTDDHIDLDICEDVDMEVDMEGGNVVGVADVVVSKDLLETVHQGPENETVDELPFQSLDGNFSTVSGDKVSLVKSQSLAKVSESEYPMKSLMVSLNNSHDDTNTSWVCKEILRHGPLCTVPKGSCIEEVHNVGDKRTNTASMGNSGVQDVSRGAFSAYSSQSQEDAEKSSFQVSVKQHQEHLENENGKTMGRTDKKVVVDSPLLNENKVEMNAGPNPVEVVKTEVAEVEYDNTCFPVKMETRLHWKPPPCSWVKLNVAGAVKGDMHSAVAAGGIIRDDSGRWVCGYNLVIGSCTPLGAELWAMFHGTKLLWERGYKQVVVESVYLEAVECIKEAPSHLDPHRALIESCRNLIKRGWKCIIQHIKPEENPWVDWLATHSEGTTMDLTLFDTPPPQLIHLL